MHAYVPLPYIARSTITPFAPAGPEETTLVEMSKVFGT
jgi:hypothetical protein